MREVIALILTAAVAYAVYSIFLVNDKTRADDGPKNPPPESVFPLEAILGVGEDTKVVVGGRTYSVGLGMISDSRCPRGEDCAELGKAILVAFIKGPGLKRTECRLETISNDRVPVGPVTLRLLRLDPHPVSGEIIRNKEYQATVVIHRKGQKEKAIVVPQGN